MNRPVFKQAGNISWFPSSPLDLVLTERKNEKALRELNLSISENPTYQQILKMINEAEQIQAPSSEFKTLLRQLENETFSKAAPAQRALYERLAGRDIEAARAVLEDTQGFYTIWNSREIIRIFLK